ncbi:hypothetical protein [Noviherbaspirillum saxi]|uniref:Uncharacterized protein n=1 Tax=Noviherbaspirillum saxi TaxID=2320863 RepID=A0A3A3FS08_9BURK|nr:hypothetical protein [Noviherbaspirillum saxi]RJF97248.1 hypothetical protein D3871_00885 [Noviherbaspirillum saxi]
MSVLTIALPAEAALPALQAFAGSAFTAVRPFLGLGVVAAVLLAFKPLLIGLLRAALLLVKPRQTLEQRAERRTLQSILLLNRMARDLDGAQPNLANELRALASRG